MQHNYENGCFSDGIGTEGSKSSIIRINSLITYFYLGELNFVSSS